MPPKFEQTESSLLSFMHKYTDMQSIAAPVLTCLRGCFAVSCKSVLRSTDCVLSCADITGEEHHDPAGPPRPATYAEARPVLLPACW